MKSRAGETFHRAIASLVAGADTVAPAVVCSLVCALVCILTMHTGAVLAGGSTTNSTGPTASALMAACTALQNISLNNKSAKHPAGGTGFNASQPVGTSNTTRNHCSTELQSVSQNNNSTQTRSRQRARVKQKTGTSHSRKARVTTSTREAELQLSATHENKAPSQADRLPADSHKDPRQKRQNLRMAGGSVMLRESNIANATENFDCSGDYRMAESIDFSKSSVRLYTSPLCNGGSFTGSLQAGSGRFENLDVHKGLLRKTEGATVAISGDINAANSGKNIDTGVVAVEAGDNNTLSQTSMTANATADGRPGTPLFNVVFSAYVRAGGGVSKFTGDSNNLSQNDVTITATAAANSNINAEVSSVVAVAAARAGGGVSDVKGHGNTLSQTNVKATATATANARVNTTGSTGSYANAYAGGEFAAVFTKDNNTFSQTDGTVSVTATATGNQPSHANAFAGGAGGALYGNNNIVAQTNLTATVSASAPAYAPAGGGIGELSGNNNTLIQTAVNVTARGSSAGSAFGLAGGDTTLRLYSGNAGGMAVCGKIANGALVHGFVDSAGYHADAGSCEGTDGNFTVLDTTRRNDWNTACQQFCSLDANCDKTSCHYPHERLLTLAQGPEGAAYLVSEQRYPYKVRSDDKGLIRISRLQRNGSELVPDLSFGPCGNGSLLLEVPGGVNRSLLRRLPLSQFVSGDYLNSLYSLPDRQEGAILVRFPINVELGNNAKIEVIQPEHLFGFPFLLEQGCSGEIIWTQEESGSSSEIRKYLLNGNRVTELQSWDLLQSNYTDDPVVAAGLGDVYFYTARRVASQLILERYQLNSGNRDDQWESYIDVPENSTEGERYQLSVLATPEREEKQQIELRPLGTVLVSANETDSNATALRITLPKFGGCASHEYFSPEFIIADRFLPLTQNTTAPACPPKSTTTSAPPRPTGQTGTPHSSCPPICKGLFTASGVVVVTGCACACCCIKKRKRIGATPSNLKKGFKNCWKKQQREVEEDRVALMLGDQDTEAFDDQE